MKELQMRPLQNGSGRFSEFGSPEPLDSASKVLCSSCVQYGTLLLVDSEEEFFEEEITKLQEDVRSRGMGLIVFADWYQVNAMVKMKFFDDNTRRWACLPRRSSIEI
jgi:hypothetical protein